MGQRKVINLGSFILNKPYKSKIKFIKEDVFKIGSIKKASQFMISLLNIANHVQMKYKNELG